MGGGDDGCNAGDCRHYSRYLSAITDNLKKKELKPKCCQCREKLVLSLRTTVRTVYVCMNMYVLLVTSGRGLGYTKSAFFF